MASHRNAYDFSKKMRVTGVRGTHQFCVHPNKSTAYIFDFSKDLFVVIDLIEGIRKAELKIEPLPFISGRNNWFGIRCINSASQTLLLALLFDSHINSYCFVIIKPKIEEGIAVVIEEHYIGIQKTFPNSYAEIVEDGNGGFHCIVYYHNIELQQTIFHVVKFETDYFNKVAQQMHRSETNGVDNVSVVKSIPERSAILPQSFGNDVRQAGYLMQSPQSYFADCDNRSVILNQTLNNLYELPFILKESITFFLCDTNRSQTITVPFHIKEQAQYCAIVPDMTFESFADQYPPDGVYSNPFCQNVTAHFYIFINERKTGELWTLELNLKKWHKCFELNKHAINHNATVVVTPDNRLFLHGSCADENCCEKAHLYHFGIPCFGSMIYPTIEQLGALFSTTKTQIYYGPNCSGKSYLLLLKALSAFKFVPHDNKNIKIFVPSNDQKTYFINYFSNLFDAEFKCKNILLLTETDFVREEFADSDIFVDGLPTLSFKQKKFLLNRPGKAIITVDVKGACLCGFDQPRSSAISWHRLQSRKKISSSNFNEIQHEDEQRPTETVAQNQLHKRRKRSRSSNIDLFQNVGEQPQTEAVSQHHLQKRMKSNGSDLDQIQIPSQQKDNMRVKHYIDMSTDAMDQFYDNWWSKSQTKQTVFIPACYDVLFKNSYLGPIDAAAAGFDERIFNDRNRYYRGQKAENDLLNLFRKFELGGVFISGFSSMEFVKSQKSQKAFRREINEFEVDAIYIHPCFGILAFEIKATENGAYLESITVKALNQLEKIMRQLSVIFKKLSGVECTVPLYCAICFPNADLSDASSINIDFILDKTGFQDETKMKSFLSSNMTYRTLDGNSMESLKIFTAALAGYRSLDFLSVGHNALAVHKMIDLQCFQHQDASNSENGIFLTNEQLAILNCLDQQQIISGPPGTGKTLVLLRKALVAAQTKKNGNVYIITRRPELNFKFKKFFEKIKESIVRLPIIHHGFESMISYSDDDDIFADEKFTNDFRITELRERLNQRGQTFVVITGLFNLLEVKSVTEWLNEHDLTRFHHFEMNTVIRSSKEIFAEWKSRFDHSDLPVFLGHNIIGPSVQRIKQQNSCKIIRTVLKVIRELFKITEYLKGSKKISLGSLCIITDSKESCTLIKSFLSSHQVPCGSIEEQIENQNIAAVSVFDKTVSQEWPIVIVSSMFHIALPAQFYLIAASRCIAKMIIIERDFFNVMKKIDEKTRSIRATRSKVSYIEFNNAVIGAERENGETDEFLMSYYSIFQAIRWNFFFTELSETRLFESCASLFDCFRFISKRPIICRCLLEQNRTLCEFLANEFVALSDKPSKLFIDITQDQNELDREKNWKIVKQLIAVLTETLEKKIKSTRPNSNKRKKMRNFFEQMNETKGAWDFVQYVILIFVY